MGICYSINNTDNKISKNHSCNTNNNNHANTHQHTKSNHTYSTLESSKAKELLNHPTKRTVSYLNEMKLCVNTQSVINGNNEFPNAKYQIISKLGEGSFGTVFKAKNLLNNTIVAMKKLLKPKLSKSESEIAEELSINNEINILKRLDHPNLLKIYEFYTTPTEYYIINDYCAYGELYKYLKEPFNENQLSVLFYQIFSGLNYLHQNDIIHRDLKLENILISDIETAIDNPVSEIQKEFYWIKLIDFGCAKINNYKQKEKTIVGTTYYMAPEVFQQNYNSKCDIWSAGVILYMLVTKSAPFNGYNDQVIKEKILLGKFNQERPELLKSSQELQDLINKLLTINVDNRLSANEALNHPWFIKFNGRRLYNNLPTNCFNSLMSNLCNFNLHSKFQQMVLAHLCHNIPSNKETRNVQKLFFHINTSNNGRLSKDELLKGITIYLGPMESMKTIDYLFLSLDGNNSGMIEYEEFLRGCLDKETILKDELLQYTFQYFAKTHLDGDEIRRKELKEMFQKCNRNNGLGSKQHIDAMCKKIIKDNDKKHNKGIDYGEFKSIIENAYAYVA